MLSLSRCREWFTGAYWSVDRPKLLAEYWAFAILGMCVMYGPVIMFVQRALRDREPLKLRWFNVGWNFTVSLLSGLAVVLLFYDSREVFSHVYNSMDLAGPAGRAAWTIFALTKCVEFGDTWLLCLRKRSFIFLHYFHHLTVALVTWHGLMVGTNYSHYPAIVNLSIHFVMYGYYGLAILFPGNRMLRFFRPYITGTQLVQMFIGMSITFHPLLLAARGYPIPDGEWNNAFFASLLYVILAYLFAQFFIDQYVKQWDSTAVLSMVTVYFGAAAGAYIQLMHGGLMDLLKVAAVTFATSALFRRCADAKHAPVSRSFLSILNAPLAMLVAIPKTEAGSGVHKRLIGKGSLDVSLLNGAHLLASGCVPFAVGAQQGWMLQGLLFGCTRWVLEWHVASVWSVI